MTLDQQKNRAQQEKPLYVNASRTHIIQIMVLVKSQGVSAKVEPEKLKIIG